MTTLAPWSASAAAVASPMPRLPPVTIATRSVRSKSGIARYYRLRMDFDHSPRVQALQKTLVDFMVEFVYPNERTYRDQLATGDHWRPPPIVDELKSKARAAGLWNLFLPESDLGAGPPRHARSHDAAAVARLWIRRRPARPRRGRLRRRPGAGRQHPPRRRARLRDRPGSPRTRPDSPLHATDRGGGGRPRTDV